jgi:hypothetical protein
MGTVVLVSVVLALALVIASGVWVAVALFTAIRRPEPSVRPQHDPSGDAKSD